MATHLALYRAFPEIGGVVHTHSEYATAWAQARRKIPCFGTTHADYFRGPVPVTEPMPAHQIESDYELNTGHSIVRRFRSLDPLAILGVLVAGHAPFCWGKTPADTAHNAVIPEEKAALAEKRSAIDARVRKVYCGGCCGATALEAVAKLAFRTVTLASDATVLERVLPTSTSSASTAPRPDTARPDTFL
ncbi:MAG TPA: class II aldolase/adducin family protein [Bryobacteraceae bacterium]|nr:class II aldolase/adducin family protein [Bryobacteraceae bacterium]